jgi:hypothetical protein
MDINSIPKHNELNQQEGEYKSKYSLKFNNPVLEKKYRETIISDIVNHLGLNHNESITNYISTYLGLSILYNTSYIWSYVDGHSNLDTLVLQLALLTSITLVKTILFYIYFLKNLSTVFKTTVLVASYFIFVEVIIFNSYIVRPKIYSGEPNYGFYSILAVIPLIYSSKFTIFSNFSTFLCVNSILSGCYLLQSLISNSNLQECIIDTLLLILINIINSHSFYSQEIRLREKYLTVNKILSQPLKKVEDRSPKTDIEEITSSVKESLQLIPLIHQ